MAALRHLARWVAWHVGEHHAAALTQSAAHITVFTTDGVEDF